MGLYDRQTAGHWLRSTIARSLFGTKGPKLMRLPNLSLELCALCSAQFVFWLIYHMGMFLVTFGFPQTETNTV